MIDYNRAGRQQGPIRIEIVLPSVAALSEVQFGAAKRLADLGKLEKKMTEEGVGTHDVRDKMRVWQGMDGCEGVIAQLQEQYALFVPRLEDDDDQGDVFRGAPVHTDPNPRVPAAEVAPEEEDRLTPEDLRDALALVFIYIPAAVITIWTEEWREQARAYAVAAYLQANDPDVAVPERPEWLVDTPLPEGWTRDSAGVVRDGNGDLVETEDLEEDFRTVIEEVTDLALTHADTNQPWVPVSALGPERWQVLHRETGERREVDATALPAIASEEYGTEEERAEQEAAAYAVYLSHREREAARTTEPEGEPVDDAAGVAAVSEGDWDIGPAAHRSVAAEEAPATDGLTLAEYAAGMGGGWAKLKPTAFEELRAVEGWPEFREFCTRYSIRCTRPGFTAVNEILLRDRAAATASESELEPAAP